MNLRRVIIVLVAAALGVWVAVAAADGGLGGSASSGTGTSSAGGGFPCPGDVGTTGITTGDGECAKHPQGFGHGHGGGGGGNGAGHRHHHHGRSGGGGTGQGEGGGGGVNNLSFTFLVRLPKGARAAGTSVGHYQAHIVRPRHAPSSCQPLMTRIPITGENGQIARVRVEPPAGGWCGGRYRVTVALNHGP